MSMIPNYTCVCCQQKGQTMRYVQLSSLIRKLPRTWTNKVSPTAQQTQDYESLMQRLHAIRDAGNTTDEAALQVCTSCYNYKSLHHKWREVSGRGSANKHIPRGNNIVRLPFDGYRWRRGAIRRTPAGAPLNVQFICTQPGCSCIKSVDINPDNEDDFTAQFPSGYHNHPPPLTSPPDNSGLHVVEDDNNLDSGEWEDGDGMSVGRTSTRGLSQEPGALAVQAPVPKVTLRDPSRPGGKFPYTLPQDGYKWRKRGTILIRGHKWPRYYYQCTTPNCPAKKAVNCSLEAEDTLIITYYGGEHNHGPITTVVASTHTPSGMKYVIESGAGDKPAPAPMPEVQLMPPLPAPMAAVPAPTDKGAHLRVPMSSTCCICDVHKSTSRHVSLPCLIQHVNQTWNEKSSATQAELDEYNMMLHRLDTLQAAGPRPHDDGALAVCMSCLNRLRKPNKWKSYLDSETGYGDAGWEEAEEQLPTSRSRRRTLSSQGLGSDSLADQGMDPYGGNGYDVNGYDLNAYLGDVNGMDAMYDYGQQGLDTMMTGLPQGTDMLADNGGAWQEGGHEYVDDGVLPEGNVPVPATLSTRCCCCGQGGGTKRRVALTAMISKLRTGFAKRVQDPSPAEQRDYDSLMQRLRAINAAGLAPEDDGALSVCTSCYNYKTLHLRWREVGGAKKREREEEEMYEQEEEEGSDEDNYGSKRNKRSYLSTTCCSCGATNIRKQAAIPTLRRNIVKTWASKVNPSKEEISDYIKLSKRLDAIQEIGPVDGYEPSLCKSCYDFKRIHLKWKDLKSASKGLRKDGDSPLARTASDLGVDRNVLPGRVDPRSPAAALLPPLLPPLPPQPVAPVLPAQPLPPVLPAQPAAALPSALPSWKNRPVSAVLKEVVAGQAGQAAKPAQGFDAASNLASPAKTISDLGGTPHANTPAAQPAPSPAAAAVAAAPTELYDAVPLVEGLDVYEVPEGYEVVGYEGEQGVEVDVRGLMSAEQWQMLIQARQQMSLLRKMAMQF